MDITVNLYNWNRGKGPDKEIPGVMVRRTDDRTFMFLPMDRLIHIADQLVDSYEQHDHERN
ncbi:hypothetical protein GCM10011374_11730 [Kocuria dechangensis]|uniref:Uncharacterized protein n=1 Tax=Kocuria dechangensis TaxID=1176249 RepID=A0A917GLG3_9MICC|nr:hypothetical protein [Kocuria dechangensis]GGG50778.1 hypothetical protein GCM10011374_11730 [Kocuria dechangensis]